MTPDRAIAMVAAGQHGVFSARQAHDAGLTPKAIEHRKNTGRWVAVHRGVYVIAGAPTTWGQTVNAAVLAYGPRAVASHRTAAALLNLLDAEERLIHITMPTGSHRERRPSIVVHEARLDRADRRDVAGVPATAPHRTLVDLASASTQRALEGALDRAVLHRLLSVASLRRYISTRRLEHNRGAKVLRELMDARTAGVTESELERMFLRSLRTHGLPEPIPQLRVGRRRIDFAYPRPRIAVELDGLHHHFSAAEFRSDRRRQNELVLAGWTPLRFTWNDVTGDWPSVERTLRDALGLPESV